MTLPHFGAVSFYCIIIIIISVAELDNVGWTMVRLTVVFVVHP